MTQLLFTCDWGTTHFRLKAIEPTTGRSLVELQSDDGVARLSQGDAAGRCDRFQWVLASAIERLTQQLGSETRGANCVVSGMASSSVGWRELPYARVPVSVEGQGLIVESLPPIEGRQGPHRVWLVSGIRSDRDIMRGEETQLIGLFDLASASQLAAGCLVILPGTHSKHVIIEGGRITGFQTFMTGELFDVLANHSLLKHSVGESETAGDQTHDPSAFLAGVKLAQSVSLSAALFRVRTRQVLDGLPPASNRALLSGLLIGSELAELTRPTSIRVPLILCATSPLAGRYREAAAELALTERLTVIAPSDVDRLTALGHARILAQAG